MVRRILAAIIALMLLAESVPADVVIYRGGKRVSGRITNRDQIRQSPRTARVIWFEPDSAGALVRGIARAEVDSVVLLDGAQTHLIDLTADISNERGMLAMPARPKLVKQGHPGLVLIATGAALFILGAAVKVGDKEVEPGLPGLAATRSYSPVNYVAMTVGAGMIVGGVARSSMYRSRATQSSAIWYPDAVTVAVAVHF